MFMRINVHVDTLDLMETKTMLFVHSLFSLKDCVTSKLLDITWGAVNPIRRPREDDMSQLKNV